MDRPRSKANRPAPVVIVIVIAAGIATLVIGALVAWLVGDNADQDSGHGNIAEVKSGPFVVSIDVSGQLAPRLVSWVSATTSGIVSEVFVHPGKSIDETSILVKLSNPSLADDLRKARLELEEVLADSKVLSTRLVDEELLAEARLARVLATRDELAVLLQAQSELLGKGVVSRIEHERTRIQFEHAEKALAIEERRLAEVVNTAAARFAASEARLSAKRLGLDQARERLRGLDVISQMSGIVQEVFIEPGETINSGDGIAQIVDLSSLVAEVRVPESRADVLVLGQDSIVRVLDKYVAARVIRIDPAVSLGNVIVDLGLVDNLPDGARPDLSVTAEIIVARFDDALFVARPRFAADGSAADISVLDESGNDLARRRVIFGKGTIREIQIIEGLAEGDWISLDSYSSAPD